MTLIVIFPLMTPRRGNPNWGRPFPPTPAVATEFEIQVERLGLSSQEYVSSVPLRRWCERNRNRVYVPEWLLEAWRIAVDTSLSDAA
jgi:hypothetical protein